MICSLLLKDRDSQKMTWITKFVEELKNDKWVLPSLKQIREICQLFPEVSSDKWVLPSLKQIREICQLFPEHLR